MSTPRLIPDIHVLLSGATSERGLARDLFLAAQRFEVQFVLCSGHFEELERVLTYPGVLKLGGGFFSPATAFGLAVELFECAELVPRLEHLDWPSCPDPKDWYLLDLLMTSGADALVTKDQHLLRLRTTLGLPIFTPPALKALDLF